MKRLVLVRHGKSSWKHDLPDDERPLKKRGYKDGKLITNFYEDFFKTPVNFWSSPAARAHETAKMFKEHFNVSDRDFKVVEDLYTFDAVQLLKTIKSCDDDVEHLYIFGHNPALTNVVNRLGTRQFDNVPTTGLVVIDFDVEQWKDIKDGQTILHLFPKNLK